jgi:hypothetical protein
MHRGSADAQSPKVRALVGPREVTVQVVEVEVHWDCREIGERKRGTCTRTFGVAGRSLLHPLIQEFEDLVGETVGVDHVIEFELLRLGGILAARDNNGVGSCPSLGLRVSSLLGLKRG